MKKFLAVLAAVAVLFSTAVFAEDLSAMTDEELMKLYQDVLDEMNRRWLPDGQETIDEQAAVQRVNLFFIAWSKNDLDDMLTMCDSGWKATAGEPRMELFRILANRTPADIEIEAVSRIAGEGPDGLPGYWVTVTSHLDRNNGTPYEKYRINLLVRKEEDGLWYVDPTGLNTCEKAEEKIPAETTAAPDESAADAADTVLYYQPNGGEYYHLNRNCKRINPKFLPLEDSFLYSEVNDEPYRNLKPCEICGAPVRNEEESTSAETEETDPFHFATFREAVEASGGGYTVTGDGYAATIIKEDERFFRAVTFFDAQGKKLYAAYQDASLPHEGIFANDAFITLADYLMKLPVAYTEELTIVPFTQEELDAMAGKTIAEVMSEPWELQMRSYPEDAEAGKDVIFPMAKGFCNYELVINEPFEVYQERRAGDHYDPVTVMSLKNYENLTVRCVRYSGVSDNTMDLRYQADGTFKRDTEQLPEEYDYDLMVEITDILAAAWENGEPDRETKEAMIAKLTEEHPEAADMIREIVESFH